MLHFCAHDVLGKHKAPDRRVDLLFQVLLNCFHELFHQLVLSGPNLLLEAEVEQDESDMFADERLHDMQEGD